MSDSSPFDDQPYDDSMTQNNEAESSPFETNSYEPSPFEASPFEEKTETENNVEVEDGEQDEEDDPFAGVPVAQSSEQAPGLDEHSFQQQEEEQETALRSVDTDVLRSVTQVIRKRIIINPTHHSSYHLRQQINNILIPQQVEI